MAQEVRDNDKELATQSPGKIKVSALLTMLDKQQRRCAISGRVLTPETCSLDHIVPFDNGGEHVITNVHLVDAMVNRCKGTLELSEFIALCKQVAAWNG